jgi:hypothetical protein
MKTLLNESLVCSSQTNFILDVGRRWSGVSPGRVSRCVVLWEAMQGVIYAQVLGTLLGITSMNSSHQIHVTSYSATSLHRTCMIRIDSMTVVCIEVITLAYLSPFITDPSLSAFP